MHKVGFSLIALSKSEEGRFLRRLVVLACKNIRMGGLQMRRNELMKPDRFSEVVLIITGATMFLFLLLTGVLAFLRK